MLLNKIPVLDKGYVALIDSSNSTKRLREITDEFYNGKSSSSLEELGTLTLVVKCPLFVQLDLSRFNLKIKNTDASELEAYIPNPAEIMSPDRQTSELISEDIARTTEALLINPRAYQADGADRFVSQVITPLNIYTTIIVHGSYKDWCELTTTQVVPEPIKAYRVAIKQIVDTEWK